MTDKKVSIIIPVYNAKNSIENLLKDLIHQSYKNIEIIFINDGSTDNTVHIIEEYARTDSRIKYTTTENQGPSNARNVGIAMAEGEFIRFCDSDDRMPENSILEMVKVAADDIDLVIGNFSCNFTNHIRGSYLEDGKYSLSDFSDVFLENLETYYFGVPWNKLYRKTILVNYNVRFPKDLSWCEDFIFNIDYYKLCRIIYAVNPKDTTYTYILHENSLSRQIPEADKLKVDEIRYLKTFSFFELSGKTAEFSLLWTGRKFYSRFNNLFKEKLLINKKYVIYRTLLIENEDYILYKAKKDGGYWTLVKLARNRIWGIILFFYFLVQTKMKNISKKFVPDAIKSVYFKGKSKSL